MQRQNADCGKRAKALVQAGRWSYLFMYLQFPRATAAALARDARSH